MKTRRSPATPWGRVLGLLMAATVTLVCVCQGMEPIVILKRSLVAALIVGGMSSLVIQTLQVLDRQMSRHSR